MLLHPLGHAMHLVEVAGLRLLFDPLLADRHHGGVFDVAPPRTVHAELLRPDFLFVSHRHPDHFDLPSLHRLAQLDPDTVVLTPDALIARTAERLGFRTVRVVPPDTRVELDGVTFVTTRSRANERPLVPEAVEWGIALAGDGACLWNQVDSILRTADVRAELERCAATLGAVPDLGIVRWCPLLEVEAMLGKAFGFPFAAHDELLEQAALLATRGVAVMPGAAGARHAAPFQAMNALVYPLDEARFLRDLRARAPEARTLPSSCGRVIDAQSGRDLGASPLVDVHAFDDDRVFRPHAIPPVFDPGARCDGSSVEAWIRGPLAAACATLGRCVLELVGVDGTRTWTLHRGEALPHDDPDWDVRNVVAASWLCEVIEGRRHFGDLLLAGVLRAASRTSGAPPIFLYRALSYATSFERAIDWETRQLLGR